MTTHTRGSIVFPTQAEQLKNAILLWPAVWRPASCWWPWWLWCHLWRGQSLSGCLQLQHWTVGWWRKMACRRPTAHCLPLWCVGAPQRPYWGCGGRCSRGQTAGPGTCLHLAHLRQHAPSSGCWRWSVGDLHPHKQTHACQRHTGTPGRKADRHTQIQPHTHTYQWSHTCIHTHKSVWVLHNPSPPSHGERMGQIKHGRANRSHGKLWRGLRLGEIRVRTENREGKVEEAGRGGGRRAWEVEEKDEEAKNRRRRKRQQMRRVRGPWEDRADRWLLWWWLCGTTLYLKEQQTGRQKDRDLENCCNSPMKHAQVISSSTAHC